MIDSPGQGRYSGAKTPSARRETGGRPVAAQDQIGLHCRRHTSDHGRPSGARRTTCGACSSVDSQRGLGLVAAEAHRHLAVLDDEVGAGGRLAGEERHAQRDRRADGRHAADARLDGPRDAEAERAGDLEPRGVAALGRRRAAAGGEAAREEDRRLGGAVGAQAAHVPARRLGPRAPRRVGELQREAVAGGDGARWPRRGGRRAARRRWRKPRGEPRHRHRGGAVEADLGRGPARRRGRAAATCRRPRRGPRRSSWRRLSPSRRTRLGVVTHRGSHGRGAREALLSAPGGSRGSASPPAARAAAGNASEARASEERPGTTRASSGSRPAGGERRPAAGEEDGRRTPRASARRRSVSRRFIPGERRKRRIVWSRPTGPLHVRE